MKKILYTLLAGSITFVSCSREADNEPTPQKEITTFTISIDQIESRATTITPTRYVMEVWSKDGASAEYVFENGTKNHAEIISNNSFSVSLDKTKAYTCLFWADDNTTFNAASLKNISLNTNKEMTEAYYAKVDVAEGKNPTVAVTLKRAVAKITLTESTNVKTTDDIALELSNIYPTFDVLTGTATGTADKWTKTIKPSATTGTFATLYFFSKADAELSELKFTYAAETEKTVSNIPMQQNFVTNIKGEYSLVGSFIFNVTAYDDWNESDNNIDINPKLYKVGDLYPDETAPIGVVFWVDATDASYNSTDKSSAKCKIVDLTETSSSSVWSNETIDNGTTSLIEGAKNSNKITSINDYSTKYPPFAWCGAKNGSTSARIKWYLPAKDELQHLYCAYVGIEPTNWHNGSYTNHPADAATKKAEFNAIFNKIAGAKPLLDRLYWSSTQISANLCWNVQLTKGYSADTNKSTGSCLTRCISKI